MNLQTTVIIVTLNRPDCVRECLSRLLRDAEVPAQIIVVDASPDDLTRLVTAQFPEVLYLRNENGYGRMTASRNIGIAHASGDIIAFLDDDAFAHPGWLRHLESTYAGQTSAGPSSTWEADSIGAVGGRALNKQPNEDKEGVDSIGTLSGDGRLLGFFAADPGRTIEVDHIMGCNMSFRRRVIEELGGFREDYPGISGVREDSDMSLRVRALGYKILFNPRACVDHIGAPQSKGQRFDVRYSFYSQRNHMVLLVRNFGWSSPIVLKYLGRSAFDSHKEFVRKVGGASLHLLAWYAGIALGLASAYTLARRLGHAPQREDEDAKRLREQLSKLK